MKLVCESEEVGIAHGRVCCRTAAQAEAEFGKYIPGSLLKEPRFIPGKQRKSLPLITNPYGVPHEAGWIDEKGVHHYAVPRPLPL